MKNTENMQWMILCKACGENPWYFNIANLHYKWAGGEQTNTARRAWYKPLILSVERQQIKAFIDYYNPTKSNPNLFDISYVEVDKVDFRRRMHFRATRKGWAAYHKQIKGGRKRPDVAQNAGYWVVEDELTGKSWKEDLRGNRLE